MPKSAKEWSLRTLRDKLIKIGDNVVRHSRYVIFQMAKMAVPRSLILQIIDRIRRSGWWRRLRGRDDTRHC